MAEFEIVPDEVRAARPRTRWTPLVDALEAGQTVFVAGERVVGSIQHAVDKRGLLLHSRKTERGGVAGHVYWAEKRS